MCKVSPRIRCRSFSFRRTAQGPPWEGTLRIACHLRTRCLRDRQVPMALCNRRPYVTDSASEKLFLRAAVIVVCQHHWHVFDQRQDAIQVTTIAIVPVQPNHFFAFKVHLFGGDLIAWFVFRDGPRNGTLVSAANRCERILFASNFISLFGKITGAAMKWSPLWRCSFASFITRCFDFLSTWHWSHSVPLELQVCRHSFFPQAGAPLTQLPGTVVLWPWRKHHESCERLPLRICICTS